MWPYIDKAVSGLIRSMVNPIFAEYAGKYMKSIDFKSFSLGTLPPTIHGIKVHETSEKELVIEPAVRWVGNPNITLVLKFLSLPITIQLLDVQVFAVPRITLRPLVPTFPCFSSLVVSLLEKPRVDFGLKLLGADVMAIPGLYQFVQEHIGRQIASLYLWPQTHDIQILDGSVGAMKKPVGILHVKVIRAVRLLKMDLLGTSDPYVQLSLSGERLPAKKTSIKMKNLSPEWNEYFKLVVKDPEFQVLQLHVYDWEKVGTHDKLGMQVVPLRLLTPYETKRFTLDLVKNPNPNDPQNKKHRGKLVVEMAFNPFKEDSEKFSGPLDCNVRKGSGVGRIPEDTLVHRGGLLLVTVEGAEDVEGKHHNNPYAMVIFRGEQKQTKLIRRTRDPRWNEEFQFVLEEAPLKEKIRIDVMSKGTGFSFRNKETLGYVNINLVDVVYNGRINQKYHLINSKNGVLSVDIRWKAL
ncbi:synaptotagmin-3 isoform X2 [Hevea brasiliensis]|nr:synaptotagmin-3 isoform X2 [Hevea brasiliensis]XP_058003488.1 synaptotagmin-3 isoform X2 [Hevea brasiliensis]